MVPFFSAPTFTVEAETGAPARLMPSSLLLVVTAMVTGVGRREGITGRGRRPGRLFPLASVGPVGVQALLVTPLWRGAGRSRRSHAPR